MFRTMLLGLVAAGSLGGAALVASPASAAPVSPLAAGVVADAGGLVQQAQYYYYGPRRYWGPRPYYRPRYYGPRPYYYGPRYYRPYYGPRYFYGPRYW